MTAHRIALGVAALLAFGSFANGLYMLISPANWYFAIPGVTSTGPFNQHFLRDIGLIFIFMGAALAAGIVRPALRVAFWGSATIWLACHALFHFWEVAVGICGPSTLVQDFPLVTLPAIITLCLTIWAARNQSQGVATTTGAASLA